MPELEPQAGRVAKPPLVPSPSTTPPPARLDVTLHQFLMGAHSATPRYQPPAGLSLPAPPYPRFPALAAPPHAARAALDDPADLPRPARLDVPLRALAPAAG